MKLHQLERQTLKPFNNEDYDNLLSHTAKGVILAKSTAASNNPQSKAPPPPVGRLILALCSISSALIDLRHYYILTAVLEQQLGREFGVSYFSFL